MPIVLAACIIQWLTVFSKEVKEWIQSLLSFQNPSESCYRAKNVANVVSLHFKYEVSYLVPNNAFLDSATPILFWVALILFCVDVKQLSLFLTFQVSIMKYATDILGDWMLACTLF